MSSNDEVAADLLRTYGFDEQADTLLYGPEVKEGLKLRYLSPITMENPSMHMKYRQRMKDGKIGPSIFLTIEGWIEK